MVGAVQSLIPSTLAAVLVLGGAACGDASAPDDNGAPGPATDGAPGPTTDDAPAPVQAPPPMVSGGAPGSMTLSLAAYAVDPPPFIRVEDIVAPGLPEGFRWLALELVIANTDIAPWISLAPHRFAVVAASGLVVFAETTLDSGCGVGMALAPGFDRSCRIQLPWPDGDRPEVLVYVDEAAREIWAEADFGAADDRTETAPECRTGTRLCRGECRNHFATDACGASCDVCGATEVCGEGLACRGARSGTNLRLGHGDFRTSETGRLEFLREAYDEARQQWIASWIPVCGTCQALGRHIKFNAAAGIAVCRTLGGSYVGYETEAIVSSSNQEFLALACESGQSIGDGCSADYFPVFEGLEVETLRLYCAF